MTPVKERNWFHQGYFVFWRVFCEPQLWMPACVRLQAHGGCHCQLLILSAWIYFIWNCSTSSTHLLWRSHPCANLQILPEKYSYYRRFDQDSSHSTDCVICMTSIDLTLRSNDCMVYFCNFGSFYLLLCVIFLLTTVWNFSCRWLHVTISFIPVACKDGWT